MTYPTRSLIINWLGKQTTSPRQVACTIDAKLCPNGTSVGRIGPNCEFAPCPIVKEPIITTTPTIPANWKIYSNNFFGFSIKYPQDWKDITTEKTITEGNRGFTLETKNKELVHGVVFDSVADHQKDSDTVKNVDLKNGKSLLLTYVECDGPGCSFGKKDIKIFTQILSTFKFTN